MRFATVPVALFCVILYMLLPSICPGSVSVTEKETESRAKKISELESDWMHNQLALAEIYRFLGQKDKAFALIRRILEVRPNWFRAMELAIQLWQEEWDAEVIAKIEAEAEEIDLPPLSKSIDTAASRNEFIDRFNRWEVSDVSYTSRKLKYLVEDSTVPALEALLESDKRNNRVVALILLSYLEQPSGYESIRHLLRNDPETFRQNYSLIINLADVKSLKEILKTRSPYPVAAAIRNLAALDDKSSITIIEPFLLDTNSYVCGAAIDALAMLGVKEGLEKGIDNFINIKEEELHELWAKQRLLRFYYLTRNKEEFEEIYSSLTKDEISVYIHRLAALLYSALDDTTNLQREIEFVEDYWTKKIEESPSNSQYYYSLAAFYTTLNIKLDKAKELCLEALKNNPRLFDRPYVYECLAVIYFKKKQYDKASLLIQAAIDLKHYELNRFKGQLKRFKEHLKKSER